MGAILEELYRECGWKARLAAPALGRILDLTRRREERRLAEGWTYEPRTFYEKNAAALAADEVEGRGSSETAAAAWVTCEPVTVG